MSITAIGSAPAGPRERASSTAGWWAFCLLALYGTMRWGTMLQQPAEGRLFLAFLLAVANAVALRQLPRRGERDWLIPLLCLADVALVLLIAGFPLRDVLGGHWGRLGSALSDGISAIPGVLVPYRGGDPNTTAVIALGAAALLVCGGLAFGNVRGRPATGQLLLAALPLLALAIVPSAIVRPKVAFLHGLLTFALVALLVLSPRLAPQRRSGGAVLLVVAAVVGAIIAAAVTDGGKPWLRVASGHVSGHGLASGLTSSGPAMFNWDQSYGALGPNASTSVLAISAKRPAYWKTEDLDRFGGVHWTATNAPDDGLTGVSPAHLKKYTETIRVDVKDMTSTDVVAAGYAYAPTLIGALSGNDPGTWTTATPLQQGTSYDIDVYAPNPSIAEMASAGSSYPASLNRYRSLNLPGSAYAGVQRLAQRLSRGVHGEIGYVEEVLGYLTPANGFVYTLHPPKGGRYPLVSFVLDSKRGYCQQFAGAMALLLRMHGIPARVAVGFSTGTLKPGTDTYEVTAKDAHAWVEVWFPTYGWVTFDPTPGTPVKGSANATTSVTTPAASGGGGSSTPGTGAAKSAGGTGNSKFAGRLHGLGGPGAGAAGGHGGVPVGTILLVLLGLCGIGLAVTVVPAYLRRPSTAELTDELAHAFAVCGRPLSADVTLTTLRARFSDSPRAAAYIAALSASRYEARGGSPTARGRAALRRSLAAGGGPAGFLRALRALPPRRSPRPS